MGLKIFLIQWFMCVAEMQGASANPIYLVHDFVALLTSHSIFCILINYEKLGLHGQKRKFEFQLASNSQFSLPRAVMCLPCFQIIIKSADCMPRPCLLISKFVWKVIWPTGKTCPRWLEVTLSQPWGWWHDGWMSAIVVGIIPSVCKEKTIYSQ